MTNFTFYGGHKLKTTSFFSFSELRYGSLEFNSKKNSPKFQTMSEIGIRAMVFEIASPPSWFLKFPKLDHCRLLSEKQSKVPSIEYTMFLVIYTTIYLNYLNFISKVLYEIKTLDTLFTSLYNHSSLPVSALLLSSSLMWH